VVPNPCLPANPADNEIVGSAIQLVLISDLFALDSPIVLCQVLQFFEKRISLPDAREWKIPEQMVNEGLESCPNERYFLGNHTILLQSKNMTLKSIKYDKYAEYGCTLATLAAAR
jgi:hypothetical protein